MCVSQIQTLGMHYYQTKADTLDFIFTPSPTAGPNLSQPYIHPSTVDTLHASSLGLLLHTWFAVDEFDHQYCLVHT